MAPDKQVELKKGLKNVYFERTRSSFIDGKEGKLLYRGYSIHDLAEHLDLRRDRIPPAPWFAANARPAQ